MEERLEIHLAEGRRFEIVDTTEQHELAGKLCHKALYGLDRPCTGCPVLALGPNDREGSSVLRVKGAYHVIRASRTRDDTAILSREIVREEVCRQILAVRLGALADEAGLSPQERKVLELLVLGRTHADIAQALTITIRTVRFHQGNLLAKLGAESRADLLRVLL